MAQAIYSNKQFNIIMSWDTCFYGNEQESPVQFCTKNHAVDYIFRFSTG